MTQVSHSIVHGPQRSSAISAHRTRGTVHRNQRAAVRIVQAALRGLYLMERAHAAQIAYHVALLGISTSTTLHTHRGIPIEKNRCEACGTNVTSCWELRASDGPSATTAVENFLSTHCRGATLTAMRKHPDFKVVANTLWARYAATVRRDGILACWPCTAPTAWELHCTSLNTNPIARPQKKPVQRPTASRLATRERDRESAQSQDDSLQQYDHLKRAFFASSDPASETAAELTLQQGWPVRKPHYANGGRPALSLHEHPMAMAPCSAVQFAGLLHRVKYVWWPRPPKTVATTQIAPPLTLTLKHTYHTHVACAPLAPIQLLPTHTPGPCRWYRWLMRTRWPVSPLPATYARLRLQ